MKFAEGWFTEVDLLRDEMREKLGVLDPQMKYVAIVNYGDIQKVTVSNDVGGLISKMIDRAPELGCGGISWHFVVGDELYEQCKQYVALKQHTIGTMQ
jgi:hypothetical protein